MRLLSVLLSLGICLVAAGCGGAHAAAPTGGQVNNVSCDASGAAGKPTKYSCTFVLNDGRRLGCNRSFNGATPSVPQLRRDGCRWLTPLKVSRSMRAVIARIERDRSCLASKGLRAVGGPAFASQPPEPTQPDGELVVTSAHPAFIAFYTDAARAERIEPVLRREDAGKRVQVERRGAVTVAWTQNPAGDVRDAVWACVS